SETVAKPTRNSRNFTISEDDGGGKHSTQTASVEKDKDRLITNFISVDKREHQIFQHDEVHNKQHSKKENNIVLFGVPGAFTKSCMMMRRQQDTVAGMVEDLSEELEELSAGGDSRQSYRPGRIVSTAITGVQTTTALVRITSSIKLRRLRGRDAIDGQSWSKAMKLEKHWWMSFGGDRRYERLSTEQDKVFYTTHGGYGYGRRRLEVRICVGSMPIWADLFFFGLWRSWPRTPLRMGMMEEAQQLLFSSKRQSQALGVGWQA
ncbi:hypothetical protein PPACK8108_LOCUS3805, partial [Phakopsora pachyrhizi]